jgi:hypothetical protein
MRRRSQGATAGNIEPPGVTVVRFDFPAFLKKVSGVGGWQEVRGPDSGVGLDYWYRAGRHEAYLNLDQGHLTVSIGQEVVFEGSVDEVQCKEA